MEKQFLVFAAFAHLMRSIFGSELVSDFKEFGEMYKCRLTNCPVLTPMMRQMLEIEGDWMIEASNDDDELIVTYFAR